MWTLIVLAIGFAIGYGTRHEGVDIGFLNYASETAHQVYSNFGKPNVPPGISREAPAR